MNNTLRDKISIEYVNSDYIDIDDRRKARGAFRWNHEDQIGEIKIARKGTNRTLLHEIGHAVNFILGKGKKKSEQLGIESEDFANLVADVLELVRYNNN